MISKLSGYLSKKLVQRNYVENGYEEIYKYTIFYILSHVIFLLITVLSGCLTNTIFESIIFYVSFQFLRRYVGGYHCENENRCLIISSILIIGSITMVSILKDTQIYTLPIIVIAVISCVFIIYECPIEHPNKPLTEHQRKKIRKFSIFVTLVMLLAIMVTYIKGLFLLYAPCCISIILVSTLLLVERIKRNLIK